MKNGKIFNLLFSLTTLFILFMICIGVIIVRGQKDISTLENRTLEKVPTFTIKKFLDGKYQSDLEKGLLDQFLKSQTIKGFFKSFDNKISRYYRTSLQKILPSICNSYRMVDLSMQIYTYGCDDILINHYVTIENYSDYIYKSIEPINKSISFLSDKVETYAYFVNSSNSINFNNVNNSLFDYIDRNLKTDNKSYLKINSFEDYKKYFFSSDHHWNYKGINQGYLDLVSLLGSKIKPLEFIGEKKLSGAYYGSFSKRTAGNEFDNFVVYKYNVPKHKTLINGKEENDYGNENYFDDKSKVNFEKYANYYALFYGDDEKEIVFDYYQPKEQNLLIIKTSFANPVAKLIASHFNKTYVVDLRKYKNFNLEEYVISNKIDKVLFLGDLVFFTDQSIRWSDKDAFQ